jgi:hypothetical protein
VITVNVTTRDCDATVPAAAVAESVYAMPSPLAFSELMPVTRLTAVVESGCAPVVAAPEGAARATVKVTPSGIAVGMLAVIFLFVSFVVMEYVVAVLVTGVGSLPGAAAASVRAAGSPETVI